MNPNRILIALLIALTLSGLPTRHLWQPDAATAQESVALTLNAIPGFENTYKEGEWFPVRVILENKGPDIEGEIIVQFVDTGTAFSPFIYPIEMPSISRKEITVYIYPSSTYATQLEVSFHTNNNLVVEKTFSLNRLGKLDDLYGVIASTPSAFNILSVLDPSNGSAVVVNLTLNDLPELAQGFGAFDGLVFSGVSTSELNQKQLEALDAWVTHGGHLLITGGPDWERTISGFKDTEILPYLPDQTLALGSTATQEAIAQIQAYSNSDLPISPTDALIIASGQQKPQAEVLLSNPQNPEEALVIRQYYGAGRVVYLAFDPSSTPFRGWTGIENFYRNLIMDQLPEPIWNKGFVDWNMAQQAVQTLPSLGLPSILLICGFLFIYILILGPINFYLLRKIKRRELGWITIPGFVLLFSMLVFISGSISRGQKPILHRLSIVQSWPGSPRARVDGVLGVYSPNRATYEVIGNYPTLLHPIPNTAVIQTNSAEILETAESISFPNLRVDVGGVYPLAYQSHTATPEFDLKLILAIDDQGVHLEGSIQNISELELENAILLSFGNILELGDISADEVMPIDQQFRPVEAGNAVVNPGSNPSSLMLPASPSSYVPMYTIEQILGTYDYYANREAYRKYALLVAAMSYSPSALSQENDIYLMGWSKKPVIDIHLAKTSFTADDLTFYIIGMRPKIEFRGERWTLTPGFFQWSSLDPFQTDVSPYNQYLYTQTRYGLVFEPRQSLEFTNVESLTFHLKNAYENGPITKANFYLWNFDTGDWEILENPAWGDIELADPGRFVAEDPGNDELGRYLAGTIRLQIESTSDYFEIATSDFTLVVVR